MSSAHDSSLVPLSDEKGVLEILTKSLLGLWETVNNLTRLRPTKRDRYRVTIFGSARIDPDHWVYAAVRDLAAELTRLGCDIVTGGGPGLMQAANEGVKLADPDGTRQKSVGIRVELPFEQDVNPFVTEAFEHRTFFSRLHHFVLVSDAFVVVPGRDRHGAGDDDGLATPPGPAPARHAAHPGRTFVGRAGRMGQDGRCSRPDAPLDQPGGLRRFRRSAAGRPGDRRRDPRTPRPVEANAGGQRVMTRRLILPEVDHPEDSAMRKTKTRPATARRRPTASASSLARYGCGPVAFTGTDDALYERRLVFDHVVDPKDAEPARAVRGRRRRRSATCSPSAGSGPSRNTTGPTPSRSTTCRWSS